jgi:hypothetical protein
MGDASTILAELDAYARRREATVEELERDLRALPTGQLVPLYETPTAATPAQAPSEVWD